jgi:hypothetical protein
MTGALRHARTSPPCPLSTQWRGGDEGRGKVHGFAEALA